MFARDENGVTNVLPKKQKTPKFWIRNSIFQWGIFIFLAAEKLTFFGGGYNFKTGYSQ